MYALLLAHNVDESAVLRLALQRAGFAVRLTTDMQQAIREWPDNPCDFILLSFRKNIPISLIKQIRALADVPMVIVTDPISEDTHVDLLDAGTDHVVLRPYSTRLLIAQLRTLLRRAARIPLFSLPSLSVGDLSLDPVSRTVNVKKSEPIQLTQLEFRLLYTLMIHPGQVVPTETLVEHIWGYSGRGDRDLVRGLVKRLRSKVESEPHIPQYILTITGVGYFLKNPE